MWSFCEDVNAKSRKAERVSLVPDYSVDDFKPQTIMVFSFLWVYCNCSN